MMNIEAKNATRISPQSTFRFSTSIFGWFPRLLRRAVLALLLFSPIILTLVFIRHYGVNVPFLDQWFFLLETMQKYFTQTLSVHDLFEQHNEHRIFFPRLVMLGLGLVTRYNTLAEMYLGWLCVCASAYLIFSIYRKTVGLSELTLVQFIPVIALLFSWRQVENWLWGFQIVIFMLVLALLCSFALLEKSKSLDRYFLGAVTTGGIASFCFANGLLIWPIGLYQLWRKQAAPIDQKNRTLDFMIWAWALIGICVNGLYLWGWSNPGYNPSFVYSFTNPQIALNYFLAVIGNPLAVERYAAQATGLLLLCLGIYAYGMKRLERIPLGSFWDALALFGMLSAAMLMIGRASGGVGQALASRYATLTGLGIIGLYVRLLVLSSQRRSLDICLYGALVGLIAQGILASGKYGLDRGRAVQGNREKAVVILQTLPRQDDAQVAEFLFYPDPATVRQLAPFLKQQKLNIFATRSSSDE